MEGKEKEEGRRRPSGDPPLSSISGGKEGSGEKGKKKRGVEKTRGTSLPYLSSGKRRGKKGKRGKNSMDVVVAAARRGRGKEKERS